MEKIRTYQIKNMKRKYPQFGVPIHWLEQFTQDCDELELYQDKDRLILKPKKREPAEANKS